MDLYRERYRTILTTIEHRVSSFETAEDLTEHVFTLAWERLQAGDGVDLRWLYTTARNVVGNEYQRRQRQLALLEKAGENIITVPSADSEDQLSEVRRRIRNLDDEQRELIYMAYWEELTGDEIAQILGCTPATARKRLQRARKAAGAALEDLRQPMEVTHE